MDEVEEVGEDRVEIDDVHEVIESKGSKKNEYLLIDDTVGIET